MPHALSSGTIDLLAYTDRECEVPKEWCAGVSLVVLPRTDRMSFQNRVSNLPSISLNQSHREESDPRFISNAADVKLRSFSTKVCGFHWCFCGQ